MDAILMGLRTGMQWNALNLTGPCWSSSAHRRFQEWVAGVFHEIWRQRLLDYDEQVGIDWGWLAADPRRRLAGPRPARIPLTERRRGEAFGSRDRRFPGRARRRGRQPPTIRSS